MKRKQNKANPRQKGILLIPDCKTRSTATDFEPALILIIVV
jgi:hypothetical protein